MKELVAFSVWRNHKSPHAHSLLQARSARAVCQQDPSVGNLKACWDTLKLDSGNSFVRLVTSSFPSARVRHSFECGAALTKCVFQKTCTH